MEDSTRAVLSAALDELPAPHHPDPRAGGEAPTLTSDLHGKKHLQLAAVFLKRTLIDLRATWLLLLNGYTPSTGSVAAALLEHALAAERLALTCDHRGGHGELTP